MLQRDHADAHEQKCFLLYCHLEEKALWKIAKSAWNGKEDSQSSQPYPNTV